MKKILQLEEAILFAGCVYLFSYFHLSWWWFALLILSPDIGMLGYLVNTRVGAYTYNLFHHKGIAVALGVAGILTSIFALQFAGFILFAHACFDRMLGYGLKYEKGFKYTHLDVLGKEVLTPQS